MHAASFPRPRSLVPEHGQTATCRATGVNRKRSLATKKKHDVHLTRLSLEHMQLGRHLAVPPCNSLVDCYRISLCGTAPAVFAMYRLRTYTSCCPRFWALYRSLRSCYPRINTASLVPNPGSMSRGKGDAELWRSAHTVEMTGVQSVDSFLF